MEKIARNAVRLAAAATAATVLLRDEERSSQQKFWRPMLLKPAAQCWITDQEHKFMKKVNTNTYVWGEGYQVDATMEYTNYTPKKIRHFEGANTPNIVDMAFGWYHEAYIDSEGRLYVSDKVKMSSIKIAEVPDGIRNLTEVTTLPRKTKVRQVVFTRRRMFVVSEDGKLFSYVI